MKTAGDEVHLAERREKTANNVVWDLGWTVAKMDDATHHTERVATKTDPGRHNTLTLKTSLECDPNGSILQKRSSLHHVQEK